MEYLVIRPFVQGQDERAWIELYNAYYGHYYGREFEPADEDDIAWWESTPWWRDTRIFMAELSGEPVGMVRAYLDRAQEPPKGYIHDLAVRLDLEEGEVPARLLEAALSWLSEQGAHIAQAYARDNMHARLRLYEQQGFKLIRTFSVMRLRPPRLAEDVKPCREVELRLADPLGREEDLLVLNRLYNEAFSEHFDFRPETPEETAAWLKHEGYEDRAWLAFLRGQPVGFVVASVSVDLPELAFKRGFISSIGVLKPFRRMGVGTSLMLAAVGWLASKGVEAVELGVDDGNPTGAPAFYERLGFRAAFKHLAFSKELRA